MQDEQILIFELRCFLRQIATFVGHQITLHPRLAEQSLSGETVHVHPVGDWRDEYGAV